MTYDCMTADELAGWREAAAILAKVSGGQPVQKPCWDCPAAFRLAEIAAGRCHKLPPVENLPERRARNREWMRLHRQQASA